MFFVTVYSQSNVVKILVPYRIGNLWGYSDTTGKVVIKPRYTQVYPFDGLYGMIRDGGVCKWIDQKGEVSAKIFGAEPDCEEYENYGHREDDETGITNIGGKYGRVDTLDFYNIPFIYEDFHPSKIENRFSLKKDNKWGVVDKNNKTIIPFKYQDVIVLDATHFLAKNDSAYGIIEISGRVVVPFNYDEIKGFDGKILIARRGENWGYINARGKQITPFKYAACQPFNKGLAIVTLTNEQIGYIDLRGREYWSDK